MLDDVYAIFFGGAAQDGVMSNESFLLNTETWEWKKLKTEETTDTDTTRANDSCSINMPRARAGHNMVRFNNNCVLVFGGAARGEAGLEPLNDLWALHVNTTLGHGTWRIIEPTIDDTKNVQGKIPPPRNAATLNEVYSQDGPGHVQEKLYILTSGWAPFRQTWDDTFILSITDVKYE